MKFDLQRFTRNHYNALYLLASSISLTLFFLSGLGRYRAILAYSIFFFFRSLFIFLKTDDRALYVIFMPTLAGMCYLDFRYGQIWPIFPNLHIVVSMLFLICEEIVVPDSAKRLLQKLSDNSIFAVCPRCKFDNTILLTRCSNCSYPNGDYDDKSAIVPLSREVGLQRDNNIDIEIEHYRKNKLHGTLSQRKLNMIGLQPDEDVLINMSVFPLIGCQKDGQRTTIKKFIMTTQRCFFINYLFLSGGWTLRDVYSYDEIVSVVSMTKSEFSQKKPFLIVKTTKTTYELIFRPLTLTFGTYFEGRDKIADIMTCFKKRRKDIEVSA